MKRGLAWAAVLAASCGNGKNGSDSPVASVDAPPATVTVPSDQGTFVATAPTAEKRYGVFEITISHDQAPYANVWEGAQVRADFTPPSGAPVSLDGFYYDKPMRDYFGARQKLVSLVDVDAVPASSATVTGGSGARIYELRSSKSVYLYLYNPSTATVSNVVARVQVPAPGTATWYDAATGNAIQSLGVSTGVQDLQAPAFSRDVVLFVKGD